MNVDKYLLKYLLFVPKPKWVYFLVAWHICYTKKAFNYQCQRRNCNLLMFIFIS